jgi:sugar/nucleoside kinase (ribokinase family)
VPVVDTTGCGDAYSAGFITGVCRGYGPEAAGRLGAAAAALVAQGLGSDARLTSFSQVQALIPAGVTSASSNTKGPR